MVGPLDKRVESDNGKELTKVGLEGSGCNWVLASCCRCSRKRLAAAAS